MTLNRVTGRPAFQPPLDTVAEHDHDAPATAHAIQRVPELLDEEYTNFLAKFDWKERFDHVV